MDIVVPNIVLGSGYTGKQIYGFDGVAHMQESPPHKRFLVRSSSPFMRLTEHHTALRTSRSERLLPGP